MNAHEKDNPPVWARGLDGHVALVTGAGRGLGRACALALSGAGARIIAVSRTGPSLRVSPARRPVPSSRGWRTSPAMRS